MVVSNERLQPAGLRALAWTLAAASLCAPGAIYSQDAPRVAPPALHTQAAAPSSPVADPHAVVTVGHARFTVLTPQMIRLEWAADGKFEDHASFVFLNRRLPVPPFTHESTGSGDTAALTLKTSALTLTYTPHPGSDGRFDAQNLAITYTLNATEHTWHPGLEDRGNLLGTTRTLDGARGDKVKEPIEPGLVSRDGWTVVDDSTRPLFDSADFSFREGEKSPWPWVMLRPAGQRQDLYFLGYGHNYRQALADYTRVAGKIPLPPRFAFGSWWSRYWAYSDQELDDLVNTFRANDVPLDVLVIDMDWHIPVEQLQGKTDQSGQRLGWTGYTWNANLFPDPDQFLSKMHREGLNLTLNMHPASGVQPWEKPYAAMARASGIDPASGKYVPFDITSKAYARNYMDILHHPLEKQGIDFWWLDWQQQMTTSLPGVNPTWWLNYVHFTDQQREGKRPLLFHRWGGLGNHRYQIGFSGDTISSWESLAFQPWFTATAANVGYAYWSHDIGGHIPGVLDPELYTRWVQFGVFSPILRTHTTKNPDAERRLWAYPEPFSDIMRNAFHLRYAMEPFLYTEARRTYDTGVAFMRPLYYDSPEADAAYSSRNEYNFGDNLIVAPVAAPLDASTQLASESIWLPQGDWIEWPTGRHLHGGSTATRRFSLEQVPVYARAGTIVPMQPEMQYTGQKPVDPLILNIFPLTDGASSTYTLYEDSGRGEQYQHGDAVWTPIRAHRTGSVLNVDIDPVRGSSPARLRTRAYELRLPADWPPSSITVNGKPVPRAVAGSPRGWRYEGNTLTTIIPISSFPTAQPVHIRVQRSAELERRSAEIDGFAGAMTRLRAAYDALNHSWPNSWSPQPLIRAMQTGDRLGYHPETAAAELDGFAAAYADALASTRQIAAHAASADPNVKRINGEDRAAADRRRARFAVSARMAVSQLEDGAPAPPAH